MQIIPATKKDQDKYRAQYGLNLKEFHFGDDYAFSLYEKLLAPDTAATSSGLVGASIRSSAVSRTNNPVRDKSKARLVQP